MEPSMDMQLPKPAVLYNYKRLCSGKNCQSTRCYKKKSSVRPLCGKDKNCQSQPINNMWSVTNSSIMQSPIPAMKQSNQDGKNCQSMKGYKKMCPVRQVCGDRNCQSANNMCSDKNQMKSVCNDKLSIYPVNSCVDNNENK